MEGIDAGEGYWRRMVWEGARERRSGNRIGTDIFKVDKESRVKIELRVWTQARVTGGG